jgi:hypothetical protein
MMEMMAMHSLYRRCGRRKEDILGSAVHIAGSKVNRKLKSQIFFSTFCSQNTIPVFSTSS